MSKFALFFLVAFAASIYAVFALGPAYGFYFYQINYFLNPSIRWWYADVPSLAYSFFTVLFICAAFLIKKKQYTLNTLSVIPEWKWLGAVLMCFALAYTVAISSEFHHRFFIEYVKMLVVIYVAFRVLDDEKKLKTALICFICGAAYIGYEAMNIGRNSTGRVEGVGMIDTGGDANMTAAALVPTIPLIIYFLWRSNWRTRAFVGLMGALIVNGLVLINSRGAFLGMLAGGAYFVCFMLFSKTKLRKQRMVAMAMIVLAGLAFIRLADDTFWARMQTLETQVDKDSEGSGGRRINFWLATFDIMEDYPMGVGIYGYQLLSPIYIKDKSSLGRTTFEGQRLRAVHSMWFQGLSEIGWHGMFFFGLLLIAIKRGMTKSRKRMSEIGRGDLYYLVLALEAGFIGFLVSASFIDAFRVQILYWMILFSFCILAICRNAEKQHAATVD